MPEATQNTFFDGHMYKVGETIPDLGSLVCIFPEGGGVGSKREYRGNSADFGKLPVYDDLSVGSCLFWDTSEYAEYDCINKAWIKYQ